MEVPNHLGGADCEDGRDFAQYYKSRYFGWVTAAGLTSAFIQRANTVSSFNIGVYNPATLQVEQIQTDFASICMNGRFGMPLLGNLPVGPTFVYQTWVPRRESIKGLSFSSSKLKFPMHGGISKTVPDVVAKYLDKTPALKGALLGTLFGSSEECKLAYGVYNKTYMLPQEAVRRLNSGELLGAALTPYVGLYVNDASHHIQILYRGLNVGELVPDGRYLVPRLNEEGYIYRRIIDAAIGAVING